MSTLATFSIGLIIQYISAFVVERGEFASVTTAQALAELLTHYNNIIEATENDLALKVER